MYLITALFFGGLVVFSSANRIDYCDPELCKPVGKYPHMGCLDNVTATKIPDLLPNCQKLNAKWKPVTNEERKLIVQMHNEIRNFVACGGLRSRHIMIRSACRMGVVEYDEALEETATFHVLNCSVGHDKCRATYNYPYSGQNIGGTRTVKLKDEKLYIKKYCLEWFMEYYNIIEGEIEKYRKSPQTAMTGHFMTFMKQENTRVGCAHIVYDDPVDVKKKRHLLTCNYSSSCLLNKPVYNSCKNPGASCAKMDETYKYLCSKDEAYDFKDPIFPLINYDGDDTEPENVCGKAPDHGMKPLATHPDAKPKGGPKADGAAKPGGDPTAGVGPKAGGAQKQEGVPKADGSPKADGEPKAGGAPKPEGVPKADGSLKADEAPKADEALKADGAPKVDGAPKPEVVPKADGGPKAGASGKINGKGHGKIVGIDDDDYFEYKMGVYPGFSSTLSSSQRVNKKVLLVLIILTRV